MIKQAGEVAYPDKPSLSTVLQQLRAEAGLSYQHLSDRSRVDVAYLHRLETGKASRPSRDVLIRIGIGLDITGLDLLITVAGHWPLLRDQNGGAQPGSPRAA